MKAIILAAGYADKLYPLTKDQPKALLPVIGRPIMNYLIDEIEKIQEIDEIFVVTNDEFEDHFIRWKEEHQFRSGLTITIVNNGTVGEESRHGAVADLGYCINKCEIRDDVLVVAGDTLIRFDLTEALKDYLTLGTDVVCGQRAKSGMDLSRFAIAKTDPDHFVIELEEKPAKPKSNLIIYALYFFERSTLPMVDEYLLNLHSPEYLGNFLEWLHLRKPLFVHVPDGDCIDIDTLTDYADAQLKFSNQEE